MPPGAGAYPGRDEFVAYLERYAERIDADVRLRCPVRRVRRAGDGWAVETAGDDLRCRHVVVAAGFNRVPVRPDLPGSESFGGPLLHSSEHHRLGELDGRRVLVAGLGNSGADLVEELRRRGAEVAVAVDGPLHLVPREILGINWRSWYRLAPEALYLLGRAGGAAPAPRRAARRRRLVERPAATVVRRPAPPWAAPAAGGRAGAPLAGAARAADRRAVPRPPPRRRGEGAAGAGGAPPGRGGAGRRPPASVRRRGPGHRLPAGSRRAARQRPAGGGGVAARRPSWRASRPVVLRLPSGAGAHPAGRPAHRAARRGRSRYAGSHPAQRVLSASSPRARTPPCARRSRSSPRNGTPR